MICPFHYAEDIDRYFFNDKVKYYLIYTPNTIVKKLEDNPKGYAHITKHLDQYQKVITSDNKPYGLHRARQPEWFEDNKKIMCVRKTMYPKFAFITNRYYVDQSVFIIRLIKHKDLSSYYILGILNSLVSHFYLYQQKKQGGQLQIDKEVLINFPFPNIDINKQEDKQSYDEVITLVKKLIDLRKEYEIVDYNFKAKLGSDDLFGEKPKIIQKEIDNYDDKLNNIIFGLYHLDKEQIDLIKLWYNTLFS